MDEFCSDVTPFLLLLPIRQLRHIYVQCFGKVRQPADIKLYTPFHHRECLYCHAGMRAFEEEPKHSRTPAMMSRINSNPMSCMSDPLPRHNP